MEASNSSVRHDNILGAFGRAGLRIDMGKEHKANRISTVSGGFAVVQPNSSLSINAVEGFPLEDFSAEAVRSQIAEAQKIVSGSGSEQDIAEAKIELEVSFDVWDSMRCELMIFRFWRPCKQFSNKGLALPGPGDD